MSTLKSTGWQFRFVAFTALVGGWLLIGLCCHQALAQEAAPGTPAAGQAKPAPPAAAAAPKAYLPKAAVDKNQQKNDSRVKAILREGKFANPAEKTMFSDYFLKYEYPRWTDPENNAKLAKFRTDVLTLQRNSTPGEPHDLLNSLTLDLMRKVAKANYHPAVRVNAMLLIGELNAAEADPGNSRPLPTPLPAAVDGMREAIEDLNQIDAARVAAMVGLARHAKLGGLSDAGVVNGVVSTLLKVLKTAEGSAAYSAEGRAWMQGQAAEFLGQLNVAGASGAVANALSAVVAQSNASFAARCPAARSLGLLNYQEAGGANAMLWANALAQLAVDACAAENGTAFSRGRLKNRIYAVSVGLSGADEQHHGILPLMADGAAKAFAAELQAGIKAMLAALDDKGLDQDALAKQLVDARTKIQKLLKKEAAPVAAK